MADFSASAKACGSDKGKGSCKEGGGGGASHSKTPPRRANHFGGAYVWAKKKLAGKPPATEFSFRGTPLSCQLPLSCQAQGPGAGAAEGHGGGASARGVPRPPPPSPYCRALWQHHGSGAEALAGGCTVRPDSGAQGGDVGSRAPRTGSEAPFTEGLCRTCHGHVFHGFAE